MLLLLLLLRSCGDDCDGKVSASQVTVTVTATPDPAGSQIGKDVATAQRRAQQTGLNVATHDASDQDETPSGDWTVCFERATLSKVDFAAVPHGAPCPKRDGLSIPWLKMPNLKGTTYGKAVAKLRSGGSDVFLGPAYADEYAGDMNNEAGQYAKWKVCFQSIRAGQPLKDKPQITLQAVKAGDACPSAKGTYKDPTNDPSYVPPDYSDSDDRSSADDGSSGGSDSSEEDYYPGDKGGCPPGGCYNPCPPGGCR
ncbi:PASTA domain-containing protein [Streptomyces sp. FL07-04A]|uniref:PASTA domain-containing protein n=1 Tax=Streptomyces sp. FL07-04A TaxID=3028658 RepID=UPI0029BB476A|nr:PASTA domain-containing protein [Streptomyces sp. FL07-04A]MDX3578383.1 PASTA domain-containing protein [Streptomyces sp. FL07-04A]